MKETVLPILPREVTSIVGDDSNVYLKQQSTIKKNKTDIIINLKLFLNEDLKPAKLYLKDKRKNFTLLNYYAPNVLRYPFSKAEDVMYYIELLGVLDLKTKSYTINRKEFRGVVFNGTKVLLVDYNTLVVGLDLDKNIFINSVLENIKNSLLYSENTMQFCKEIEKERDYNLFMEGDKS